MKYETAPSLHGYILYLYTCTIKDNFHKGPFYGNISGFFLQKEDIFCDFFQYFERNLIFATFFLHNSTYFTLKILFLFIYFLSTVLKHCNWDLVQLNNWSSALITSYLKCLLSLTLAKSQANADVIELRLVDTHRNAAGPLYCQTVFCLKQTRIPHSPALGVTTQECRQTTWTAGMLCRMSQGRDNFP